MIRIAAISDLHLGMKFSSYPQVGSALEEMRYSSLDRVVSIANDEHADLIVIAGDLFDRRRVSEQVIARCVASLSEFEGAAIVVLPGNHDYSAGATEPPWGVFSKAALDARINLMLLLEQRIYEIEVAGRICTFLPGPCASKHSDTHALGWISDTLESVSVDGGSTSDSSPETSRSDRLVVGIAHGSVEGVSPDPDRRYYPMRLDDLSRIRADMWIIGHTHVHRDENLRSGQRLIVPGTHEPDGFDCKHSGSIYLIEVTGDASTIRSVESGTYRFIELSLEVGSFDQIEREVEEALDTFDPGTTLCRLLLSGSLDGDDRIHYSKWRKSFLDTYFFSEIEDASLRDRITQVSIDEQYVASSFPHRLLSKLIEDPDALQLAAEYLEQVSD